MKELIESVKDFKIIPHNFKSAVAFDLLDVDENVIKAKLSLVEEGELSDYAPDSTVEVFGVNNVGLVYFETKIISRKDDIREIATTQDYSIIQRREYSRVTLKQGSIKFKDLEENIVKEILDISAGGVKIVTYKPLETDKTYDIELLLSNNMTINCKLQPVRIQKLNDSNYNISGKFVNLENVDRIVLVQYAFKIKLEDENKESK